MFGKLENGTKNQGFMDYTSKKDGTLKVPGPTS